MTTLYISNTTRQNHLFQVRWLGDHNGRPFSRFIASGQQIKLTDDDLGAGADQKWNSITRHLEMMKARDAAELHGSQIQDYKGISYRYERPVSADEIRMGNDMVLDNADRVSAEEALNAAEGTQGAALAVNGNEMGRARVTKVEVVQDYDPRQGPQRSDIKMSVETDPQGRARRPAKLKRNR